MNSSLSGGAQVYDPGQHGQLYYNTEGLLAAFYLVKPSRTFCANMDETPNFYNMVSTVVPVLLVFESILLKLQGRPAYKMNNALAGICALIIANVPQGLYMTAVFTLYTWIWTNFRIIDLAYDSMWTWLFCILALDFTMYVVHRLEHEINYLWAAHQLHHSSEYYDLFAAGKNSFLDKFHIGIGALPWALILPPGPAMAHHQLNLVYQSWIHTLSLGDLGLLEYIIVTPTQHAIHHGRNRFCIDKNYGGVLSIWDQLFGTMEWPSNHRHQTVYYGTVCPVKSWDIAYGYLYSFRGIYRKMCKYDNLGDKLAALWKGPGWEPGKPRLGYYEEIPEDPDDKEPYDKQSSSLVYVYCFLHLAVAFFMSSPVVEGQKVLPVHVQAVAFAFIIWTVIDVGYVLEHKWFVPMLEWTRCALFFVIESFIIGDVFASFGVGLSLIKLLSALSIIVCTFNLTYFTTKTKVQ